MHEIRITIELILNFDKKSYEIAVKNAMCVLTKAPGIREIRVYQKFIDTLNRARFIHIAWKDRISWMKFQNSIEWKKMNQELIPYVNYLMVEELEPSSIFPEPIVVLERVREWINDHFGEELRHSSHTNDLMSLLVEQHNKSNVIVTTETADCRCRKKSAQ